MNRIPFGWREIFVGKTEESRIMVERKNQNIDLSQQTQAMLRPPLFIASFNGLGKKEPNLK